MLLVRLGILQEVLYFLAKAVTPGLVFEYGTFFNRGNKVFSILCWCFCSNKGKALEKLSVACYCSHFLSGGLGQLGRSLAAVLRKTHGSENVFLTDIKTAPDEVLAAGRCFSFS